MLMVMLALLLCCNLRRGAEMKMTDLKQLSKNLLMASQLD
jgi:hypothetical protein